MLKKYKKKESAIVGIIAIALAVVFVIAYITISLSKSTWSPLEWTSGSWHGHLNVNSEYVGDNPDVVPGGDGDNPDVVPGGDGDNPDVVPGGDREAKSYIV